MNLISSILNGGKTIFNNELKVKTENRFFSMMIDRITNAPVNLYFDITPTSRILNYFNVDLKSIDNFLVD